MRTIALIGRSRATGKLVLLCDSGSASEQIRAYKELSRSGRVNEELSSAALVNCDPIKTEIRFSTPDTVKTVRKQGKSKAPKAEN